MPTKLAHLRISVHIEGCDVVLRFSVIRKEIRNIFDRLIMKGEASQREREMANLLVCSSFNFFGLLVKCLAHCG